MQKPWAYVTKTAKVLYARGPNLSTLGTPSRWS